MVPSSRNAAVSPAVIVSPPSVARLPAGKPEAAVPSVIASMRDGLLGGDRGSDERWMNMKAVADDFRGDLLGLENRPDQPRRAMAERRHAVEEMRRLPRARGNRGKGLIVGRRGMPERYAMPTRRQPGNQVESRRRALARG